MAKAALLDIKRKRYKPFRVAGIQRLWILFQNDSLTHCFKNKQTLKDIFKEESWNDRIQFNHEFLEGFQNYKEIRRFMQACWATFC